ncbi:tRNA-splicing endonuclease subunit Sen2 [Cephus cinctus]|uniref:tRNA-splicing endonuclease subunit Sen2 n=1 Tax=Cephus cinctus TaxID=211228 RepID=A0AAJ7RLK3_CEPCN|nr:tRNA-splicing endonuclease subunit Sen2 [Cephus cinctus]XP_015599328.1 tRNA-splicing endonuclease subunit Sen2 [Cephus cinctus]XP_024942809.1 tRNA-splicing endonuclease subunit Sen2 [Cephus cinctus]
MNLRDPKKKKRVRKQMLDPFPIALSKPNEWTVYTAYLSSMGTYIVQPDEMEAVHSMGFFGKGSLSKSYPSFGRTRYGVPPIVRNRQWCRRQKWLKEVKKFDTESLLKEGRGNWDNENIESDSDLYEISNKIPKKNEAGKASDKNNDINKESLDIYIEGSVEEDKSVSDIIEITEIKRDKISNNSNRNYANPDEHLSENLVIISDTNIDEVVLDSTEEEDVCEIVSKDLDIVSGENDCFSIDHEVLHPIKNESDISESVLVLPDSDSDVEDYLSNVKPRIQNEGFPVRETLHLTFQETFFLMFGLGCLQVIDFEGNFLSIKNAWNYFCKEQTDFVQKYVVYHYFRSKGWVVKSGLKYGGDFLLYKQGPPFYHASYIVILEVLDADTLIRNEKKTMRSMTWNNLFGLHRLSETAAKEILFAQVLWPSTIPKDSSLTTPEMLSEFTVREVLWRRWISKQKSDMILLEEEDEDSL